MILYPFNFLNINFREGCDFSSYHDGLETLETQLNDAPEHLKQKHQVETILYRFSEPWGDTCDNS